MKKYNFFRMSFHIPIWHDGFARKLRRNHVNCSDIMLKFSYIYMNIRLVAWIYVNLREKTWVQNQLRPFRNKLRNLKTWANWKKNGSFLTGHPNTWPENSSRKDSSALLPDKLIRAQIILWSACFLCPILIDLFVFLDWSYLSGCCSGTSGTCSGLGFIETKSPICSLSSEDESYAIRTDSKSTQALSASKS